MKRLDAVWRQCRLWKMPEVGGHQDFRVALDGRREHMAVAVIGKGELADKAVVVLDGRLGDVLLHKGADALDLVGRQVGRSRARASVHSFCTRSDQRGR
jgi:hypothetical protein